MTDGRVCRTDDGNLGELLGQLRHEVVGVPKTTNHYYRLDVGVGLQTLSDQIEILCQNRLEETEDLVSADLISTVFNTLSGCLLSTSLGLLALRIMHEPTYLPFQYHFVVFYRCCLIVRTVDENLMYCSRSGLKVMLVEPMLQLSEVRIGMVHKFSFAYVHVFQ